MEYKNDFIRAKNIVNKICQNQIDEMKGEFEKRHFTPSIEDIRVGYECERQVIDYSKEFCCPSELYEYYLLGDKFDWEKYILTQEDVVQVNLFPPNGDLREDKGHPILGWYRTPYLTKEQVREEGWNVKNPPTIQGQTLQSAPYYKFFFEKGNCMGILLNDGRVELLLKDVLLDDRTERSSNGRLYLGECKDINTFRYISKLLGI